MDFGNVDQSPVSTSTNANQDDLFREGFASNANPTSESQFDALDVNNSNNLLPTTTTTEQTDIFAGDSSNSAALPAPSPVVEQFDTFDDQPSDEPAATQSTAVESDLFSGSNSNTEALLRSAQAEYSNYEPFNEQTTVTTEASNAIESDVLGESNAPSNVTLDDNIVEYQADQNEAPRELPPTAEEIITSSSEKSGTG